MGLALLTQGGVLSGVLPTALVSAGSEKDTAVNIGGVDLELVPLKKNEAQKLVDVIKSVDHTAYTNYEVMDIVIEEAESYWNGEKSSREVADIIQSRISIFINENN